WQAGHRLDHEAVPDRRREGPAERMEPRKLATGQDGRPGHVGVSLDVPVAVPHAGGQLGDVADEPGVREVLGGAGLPRGWASDVCLRPGAAADHASEEARDAGGDLRVEDLLA